MTARAGIVSYGTYVPYHRLRRAAILEAHGQAGTATGSRAVASFDEDTTSMGVEAGRAALRAGPGVGPRALYFATTAPAYADKTNATAVHAALGLAQDTFAVDVAGAVRCGIGALRAAADGARPSLAVLSDMRTGLPGGQDELSGGDAAAAFLLASPTEAPVVAELVGVGCATGEFLDRWRLPGEPASRRWEERFGQMIYLPLAQSAIESALKSAGITPNQVDYVGVTGTHARAVSVLASQLATTSALVDDHQLTVGGTGTAHPGLVLATALDTVQPGMTIVLVSLADGADVLVWRTTDALIDLRSRRTTTVHRQVEAATGELTYLRYLSWRGFVRGERPRRPDPQAPAAPPSHRSVDWKFALDGTRCTSCGTRHLPAERVCAHCRAIDQMAPERFAELPGTIATFTLDRLVFSENPPVVVGVVDFDGGGRYRCELTDVDPSAVAISDRVEMTFRRLYTAGGIHNYFWKARPARG
jgi:hydroxymethylglutaryl-CoA synthase